MLSPRRRRFVFAHVLLLLGVLLTLTVVDVFSLGLFVLLAVLGALVGTELLVSSTIEPRWYGRVRLLLVAGLVLAVVTVGYRLGDLVAPEVMPWP